MSNLSKNVFKGVGVIVKLLDEEDFMVIRETLSRIGVSPKGKNILYQSCHLVHKDGTYVIAHFKELFALDDLPSNVSEDDIKRRNAIINLLEEWDLLEIVEKEKTKDAMPINGLKIIRYSEKDNWQLIPKFNTGSLRRFFNS
jgi:hypothetical protein